MLPSDAMSKSEPISALAFCLDQIRQQKEGPAPAAEEAPAEA